MLTLPLLLSYVKDLSTSLMLNTAKRILIHSVITRPSSITPRSRIVSLLQKFVRRQLLTPPPQSPKKLPNPPPNPPLLQLPRRRRRRRRRRKRKKRKMIFLKRSPKPRTPSILCLRVTLISKTGNAHTPTSIHGVQEEVSNGSMASE